MDGSLSLTLQGRRWRVAAREELEGRIKVSSVRKGQQIYSCSDSYTMIRWL